MYCRVVYVARTPPFEGGEGGSIPPPATVWEAEVVKAPGCDSGRCGFESRLTPKKNVILEVTLENTPRGSAK